MAPRRVNREVVRARLPGVDGWIIENLIDSFEPAALAAVTKADKKPKPAEEASQ